MKKIKVISLLTLLGLSLLPLRITEGVALQPGGRLDIKLWVPRGGDVSAAVISFDPEIESIYAVEGNNLRLSKGSGNVVLRFFTEQGRRDLDQCDDFETERCVTDALLMSKSKGYIIVMAQNDGSTISDNLLKSVVYYDDVAAKHKLASFDFKLQTGYYLNLGDAHSTDVLGIIFAYDFQAGWIEPQFMLTSVGNQDLIWINNNIQHRCESNRFMGYVYGVDYYIRYYTNTALNNDYQDSIDFFSAIVNMYRNSYFPPIENCPVYSL